MQTIEELRYRLSLDALGESMELHDKLWQEINDEMSCWDRGRDLDSGLNRELFDVAALLHSANETLLRTKSAVLKINL